MNRATVRKIIGFAFLAFAVVSIYRSEFGVGKGGGLIITRAHEPEAFWRGVIIQIVVGCALLYLSRLARSRRIAHLTVGDDRAQEAEPTEERPKLPNYDPAFCGKVVKGAACVCVGLSIAGLLVLLFVHPSDDRCAGWIIHPDQPSAASLWVLAGMFNVLPALWISNVALRWDRYYARSCTTPLPTGPRQGS